VIPHRPDVGARVPAWRARPAGLTEGRWLVVGLLSVAAALSVAEGRATHQHGGQLLILLMLCVPVVVMRRWPLPAVCAVTIADGLVAARGMASLPCGILLGVALYFSALKLSRPRSIELALAVTAVLSATLLYSAFTVVNAQVAADAVENLVPLGGAWFIADSVAARRRYQAGLAAQAERERAAEVREERVRIAREMHDIVAHTLAVMTVQAGVGRRLAARRPEEATAALESIETIGRTAQEELSVVLGLLRNGEAGSAPLAPLPRLIDLKELADTVRSSGVPVELRMEGTDRRLSPSLELSIYRVMQEALTNVVKHAPGARAEAELAISAGKVRLEVRDDGGMDGHAPRTGLGTGHGIVGMRERIGAFGGSLVAEPIVGGGFRVTAEVPIEGSAS
jgi:signal transduction histidine kinase